MEFSTMGCRVILGMDAFLLPSSRSILYLNRSPYRWSITCRYRLMKSISSFTVTTSLPFWML